MRAHQNKRGCATDAHFFKMPTINLSALVYLFTHGGRVEDVKKLLGILSDRYRAKVQHRITLWFFILGGQISQQEIWIAG